MRQQSRAASAETRLDDSGTTAQTRVRVGNLLGEPAEFIERSSIKDRVPQIEAAVADDAVALVLRVLAAPSAADTEAFREFGIRHDIDFYWQPGGPGTVAPLDRARPLRYRLPEFGLTFEFLPMDFVQVNAGINAELVSTAVRLAQVQATDRVLDLYCGIGNFSLPLARSPLKRACSAMPRQAPNPPPRPSRDKL